jgi:hypothetical protein
VKKMDEQTKRNLIKKYFEGVPDWAKWVAGLGVLLLLVGLGMGEAVVIILGIVAIGVAAFGIYSATQGKPTDRQMDEWLEEDLKALEKRALDKVGTTETEIVADPVCITGLRFWDTGGADFKWRKGKDNVIRFTPHGVSVMHFAQHQLLAYSCVFDLTTGKALNEGTDEYFYKDVVSVATKTESFTGTIKKMGGREEKVQLDAAEKFTLTTSGGTSVSVLLRDPKFTEERLGKGGEIPITRAEKAVHAIRKMIREKKA